MADTIDIRIIGKDEASASLASVRGEVRGLGGDAGGLRGTLGSLGGVVGTLGKVALGVAGGGLLALGASLVSGVGDARQAAQIMAQTEAVIKSTGGAAGVTAQQVADYAASLSAASGKSLFGDDQIQQSANLLLTFTNIKDKTLEAATAISVDMAQALGGEPQAQAIQLGKALNDPIQGISALTRVGVTFTEEQKNQIKTMQEAGDMAGAQGVILAELNKEFGGSAEAAAKADGGWAQFQDRLGELGETVGAAVLPLLEKVVGFLNDSVLPVVEDLATNGIPALTAAWETIQPVIDTIVGALSGDLGPSLDQAASTFQAVQDTVDAVMPAIEAVVGAVLEQVVAFWHTHGDDIMAFVQTTWDTINEIIQIAMQLIQATIVPILTTIAGFISAHGTEIQAILGNVWNAIKAIIDAALTIIKGVLTAALQIIKGDWSGAWETIKTMFARVWDDIKIVLGAALDTVKQVLSLAWDAIKGTVTSAWDSIKETISGVADSIVSTLEELPGKVGSIGSDIIQGIIDGVRGAAGQLYSALRSIAEDALEAAKDAIGIGSPSKLFADEMGKPIIQGILEGMLATIPDLMGLVDELGNSLGDKVADLASSIHDTLADMFDITASVDRQMAKNIEAVSRLASNMQAAVQAELDQAQQEAAQFENPEQAAKFFKLRSDQILEIANMEEDIRAANEEGDYQRASDLARQIELIKAAQEAERKAFGERAQGAGPFGGGLMEDIGKLFEAGNLGEGTPDALAIAMATLSRLLGQLAGVVPGGVTLPGPGMNALQATGTGAGPGGGLTVIVNGAPGQSEQTIADKVIAEIERRYRGRL